MAMLALISPAKSLDFETPSLTTERSEPAMGEDTAALIKALRPKSTTKLKALMSLSDALAELNHERFQAFELEPAPEATKQAIMAFSGDTYKEMGLDGLDEQGWARVQDQIRILSGLYGVLRPLDAIQPYRLEMGTKLKTRRGANLYAFWGDRIVKELNAHIAQTGATHVVNCASNEYFKAARAAKLSVPVVTPVFKDFSKGEYKVISFYAKRARGAMASYIARHGLTDPSELAGFDHGGYAWDEASSTPEAPVFLRRDQD
jgi:hypothetical protein